MNEMEQLKAKVAYLEGIIFEIAKSDRYVFKRDMQFEPGRQIHVGRSTGLTIASATDQKLGFFGAAPVLRQQITAPYTAADIGTGLINLGLFYQ